MPAANKFLERFFAEKLFARLNIDPPFDMEPERPDCIFTSGGKRVGMEITSSIPRDVFRSQKLAQEIASQKPGSTVVYSKTSLRSSEEVPIRKQIIEDMLNPANSSSELGDCEKAFCDDLKTAWEKKRTKLNEVRYQRCDQNWLLVWDNERLSECEETFDILRPIMKNIAFYERDRIREPLEFDRIYALSGSFTIEFAEQDYRIWRELTD